MARRPRYHFPSTIYHVIMRGNDGQPIFFSDEDRCRMCLLIQEGVERFGHAIHAFCFMSNHVHLAVQVDEKSISHIIQNLAFRYTRYYNKRHDRYGHLFQGRFKSIVIDSHCYLKELIRYIHLNPVRAHLVQNAETYLWSSHRAYLLLDEYVWLDSDKILKNFGSSRQEAMIHYQSYIQNEPAVDVTMNIKSGYSNGILGGEEFVDEFFSKVEQVEKRELILSEVVSGICKHFDISLKDLCSPGKQKFESYVRATLALLVRESDNLSFEELAVYLRREPSGLSKLATRLEQRCLQDPILAAEVNELRNKIYHPSLQMSGCQA